MVHGNIGQVYALSCVAGHGMCSKPAHTEVFLTALRANRWAQLLTLVAASPVTGAFSLTCFSECSMHVKKSLAMWAVAMERFLQDNGEVFLDAQAEHYSVSGTAVWMQQGNLAVWWISAVVFRASSIWRRTS